MKLTVTFKNTKKVGKLIFNWKIKIRNWKIKKLGLLRYINKILTLTIIESLLKL